MKRSLNAVLFAIALVSGASLAFAEMMPIEPGTVKAYPSSNGIYQVRVSYNELGGASLSVYKGSERIWSELLSSRPGRVRVSDNGEVVVAATFGWEDEGGADGFVVYNTRTGASKEVQFNPLNNTKASLKWIEVLEISSDGKYVAFGEERQKGSRITVYDTATGESVFWQDAGFDNCVAFVMAPGLERSVLVTRNDDLDMAFVRFDKTGEITGSQMIKKNFSYDVPVYVKFDGNGDVLIFDLNANAFIPAKFGKK
jgi:hypothetical protein